MGVAMTPQELTNRYDNLCKTMTPTQAYSILQEETGRTKKQLKDSISRYKIRLGTNPSRLNALLVDSTMKKTEEKIEQLSETISDMLVNQSELIIKGNALLIQKFYEMLEQCEDVGGASSLNQLASALYRMQDIRDKAQVFQDTQDNQYVSENKDAIYNLYFKDDDNG